MTAPTTRQVPTVALRPGMRVDLWLGQIRTVQSVTPTGDVNMRGVTLWSVMYAEGRTADWSAGNSGASDTLWTVIEDAS
jgi:hypothetical protein